MNKENIDEEDYHLKGSIFINHVKVLDYGDAFPFGYLLLPKYYYVSKCIGGFSAIIGCGYLIYMLPRILKTFWEWIVPVIVFVLMEIMGIYFLKYTLDVIIGEDKIKTLYVERSEIRRDYFNDQRGIDRRFLYVEFIDDDNKKYSLQTSPTLEKYFFEGLGCRAVCKRREVVRILSMDTEL